MPQLAFEQTPNMLLQCRRKLLNVRWPYIMSVIHEWRVKYMSSSPCPVEVNEAYLRGLPQIPVPRETCMSKQACNDDMCTSIL